MGEDEKQLGKEREKIGFQMMTEVRIRIGYTVLCDVVQRACFFFSCSQR